MRKRIKKQTAAHKNKMLNFCLMFVMGLFNFAISSYCADNYVITDTTTGNSFPVTSSGENSFQATLQSTSVDWEAVTGLYLQQYSIKFINTSVTGTKGWEIYYLDAFPCYGYGQYVRAWMNINDSDGSIRLNCLRAPREIMLAMREATKDESQGVTTNLLKCKVEKNLSVSLDKCEKKPWDEFIKEQS